MTGITKNQSATEDRAIDRLPNGLVGYEDTAQEKKFTQNDVNRIVQERLARVKDGAAKPSERELELERRETDLYLKEKIKELGFPESVYESLKGLDRETMDLCINIITPYIHKAQEPILNPTLPVGNSPSMVGGDLIRKAMGLAK